MKKLERKRDWGMGKAVLLLIAVISILCREEKKD